MIFLVQEQPSHRSWLSLVLIFLLWSYKLHNLTQFLWPGHLIMSLAAAQNVMWPCYHVRKAKRQFLLSCCRLDEVFHCGLGSWGVRQLLFVIGLISWILLLYQGCYNWQGPQGLWFSWILPNRQLLWQWRHATDVAATVSALPAKNGRGGPGCMLVSRAVTSAWKSCSSWFSAD